MALPSGKFWIPIPSVNKIADVKVALSGLAINEPKAHPITNPSGILWTVILDINKKFLFLLLLVLVNSLH